MTSSRKSHRGGTISLLLKSFKHSLICSVSKFNCEIVIVDIFLAKETRFFIIYFPPNVNFAGTSLSTFFNSAELNTLLGDFNFRVGFLMILLHSISIITELFHLKVSLLLALFSF